jgi:hypothetical protein
MGFVGVSHGVQIPGLKLFFANIHVHVAAPHLCDGFCLTSSS